MPFYRSSTPETLKDTERIHLIADGVLLIKLLFTANRHEYETVLNTVHTDKWKRKTCDTPQCRADLVGSHTFDTSRLLLIRLAL